jgi:hypothetical protein
MPMAALEIYGPLGLMAAVAMFIAGKLYLDLKAERKAHTKTVTEWTERHVAKAESWMTRYAELADSLNSVLASLERRYDRR